MTGNGPVSIRVADIRDSAVRTVAGREAFWLVTIKLPLKEQLPSR